MHIMDIIKSGQIESNAVTGNAYSVPHLCFSFDSFFYEVSHLLCTAIVNFSFRKKS
jgi:hypothetical protein